MRSPRSTAATAPPPAALRALLSEAGLIRERIRIEALWLLHLSGRRCRSLPGAKLPAAVRARAEDTGA